MLVIKLVNIMLVNKVGQYIKLVNNVGYKVG